MEHKVGETFQYGDVTLQVVACDGSICGDCYFDKNWHCSLYYSCTDCKDEFWNKERTDIKIVTKDKDKKEKESL